MSKEKEHSSIEKVQVVEHHAGHAVMDIPSDEGDISLDIVFGFGDAFITVKGFKEPGNLDSFIKLPFPHPLRFRTYSGGGAFPDISSELKYVLKSFNQYDGEIPPEFSESRHVGFSSAYTHPHVQNGKENDDFSLKISNLACDDDEEGKRFMDITVLKSGDTRVKVTDLKMKGILEDVEAEMLFKTKENGGKNPIMASVFTNIAKIVAIGTENRNPTKRIKLQ